MVPVSGVAQTLNRVMVLVVMVDRRLSRCVVRAVFGTTRRTRPARHSLVANSKQ